MNRAVSILRQRLAAIAPMLTTLLLMICFAMLPAVLVGSGSAIAAISHAPDSAQAYLIAPTDGETVSSEFTVKFGLSDMGIAPAGVDKAGTGHHHLLIDVEQLPPLDEPLMATSQIRHFGGGQTETTLTLPPGEHTLQLLLGNYSHIPHDNPVLSDKISITVK